MLVLMTIVSCGQDQNRYLRFDVISQALPYIKEFELASKLNGKPLIVNDLMVVFKDDSFFTKTELAVCSLTYNNLEVPVISIKASYWNNKTTTYFDKREVMFHELGHCALGLLHNDTEDQIENAVSIMNRYHLGPNLYNETTMSSYDTELFTGHNPTTIGE